MARTIKFMLWGALLFSLAGCSPKQAPDVAIKSVPSRPLPKTQAVPSTTPAVPLDIPSYPSLHKVGLLLPLTGPHAPLGKGMLDAAEMALFEAGVPTLTLLPQDTAQGAHQAALKALDEGAELLLGPIFAPEAEMIRPLLSARQVNLICFSTDQTAAGNGIFVLGILPDQQIERIIEFIKGKELSKIAALLPNDLYGRFISQILKRLEKKGLIHLLGITFYTKGDLLEGNPGNTRLIETIDTYKTKGLEALLIPEGGENLAHLTRLLNPYMPLKILGSGQWDNPDTLHLAFGLQGALFASTNPQERQDFERQFQKFYGYSPPRIATLAYDAVALAAALAGKGYTVHNLTFSQGFSGIDGLFRLTPQGLNERGLAVLEINPNAFRVIDPAPQTF